MIVENRNGLGACVGNEDDDDYVEIMGIEDDEVYQVPRDVLEIVDGMGEEEITDEVLLYPELMGAFFKRIFRKRRKRRKAMKKKMRGMSKKQKRRFKRKIRRKRRRKITKQMILRFAPGGRIVRAIKLRRKLKKLRAAKKKRARAKRAKKKSRIAPLYVPPLDEPEIFVEPEQRYKQKFRRRRRPIRPVQQRPYQQQTREQPVAPMYEEPVGPGPEEQEGPGPEAKGAGLKKMLPMIAVAGLGAVMLMGKKKG